jgi:signal transduction histidine kinase/ligand-binding sensor domain-containing protein
MLNRKQTRPPRAASKLMALFAFCLATFASGQASPSPFQYTRTLWRVANGLPEDTVQSLAESPDGLLWIGTTSGLARFDGSRLQAYARGSAQLAGNSIFCLTVTRDGTLWAGTEGSGLLRLRGTELKTYSIAEGLTDGFVRTVFEDEQQRLWIGTDDGLFLMQDGRIQRIDQGGQGGIAPIAVHSITEDSDHRIWVGGSRLIAIDPPGHAPSGHAQDYPLPGAYSQNRVKRILQTSDGTVWVGTVGGLQRLEKGVFRAVPGIHATVRSLLQTADGTLWIGTIGDGLWTLRSGQGTQTHGQLTQVSRSGLLPSDTVLSILEDNLGQIWVGTQAGLVRLNKTAVGVVPLPQSGDPDFETLSGDDRGNVWVAAQLLYLIHNGVAQRITYPGLGDATVRNVFRAHDGALWIGTDGSGAYRIQDPAHPAQVTHFTAPADLSNNFVRAFMEARDGTVWIATDEGVSRIGGPAPHTFTEANGLAFFSTRSLLEDRDAGVWIGTDRGLSHWLHGRFVRDAATKALAQEKVWSILEDRSGVLWFGTRDHGLFRYRNGQVQAFTTGEGLPSNSVYQILQDRSGTFWLSGPNQIASIAEAQMDSTAPSVSSPLSVTVYDMPFGADGAQIYGGRQPSGYLAPDDSVWFPTSRGAAHIAHATPAQGPAPRAVVDDVIADGRSISMNATNNGDLRIAAGVSRLRFDFSAVSLRSQAGVRFRYKLEDFDQAWNTPSEDLTASYTNLPAGHYRLRVVAFDSSRPTEISEADLDFVKAPYIYQTWWFYTLLGVLLVLLGAAAYRLRVLRIRRQFLAVLEERNRLAREMHDTVIQGCAGISALLEAMASTNGNADGVQHELLDFAREQARSTINEARHAVWNMRHEQEKDVDLVEAIQGVAAQTRREFGTDVDFTPTLKHCEMGTSAAHEILMTVREAVYNSVQHSGTNKVQLHLNIVGEDLTIDVADSGIGFVQNAEAVQQGHYGVLGMQERVQRLGGTFELNSSPGSGTRVRMTVPAQHRQVDYAD